MMEGVDLQEAKELGSSVDELSYFSTGSDVMEYRLDKRCNQRHRKNAQGRYCTRVELEQTRCRRHRTTTHQPQGSVDSSLSSFKEVHKPIPSL